MNTRPQSVTRRGFLQRTLQRAGWAGMAAAAVQQSPAANRLPDRFHYNIDHLRKTDPALVKYRQSASFACGDTEVRRLAIGPDDRLYLAGGHNLRVFKPDGSLVSTFDLAGAPRAVKVAADGKLFVAFRDHLEILDSRGKVEQKWDSPGPKTFLTGVAVGDQDVFLADAGTRVVLRYDRTGKLVRRIGERTKENLGFVVPSPYLDVEIGPEGLLWVNNPGRHRVDAYTFDGQLEFSWGKASAAITGFCGCCNPINLSLLSNGQLVTCEKGLARVKVYQHDGTFEGVVAGAESFPAHKLALSAPDPVDGSLLGLDAVVDSRGNVCVLDPVARQVQIFTPKSTTS